MHPLVPEIAGRLGLKKSGERFAGRCPECGGGDDSTRFVFWPTGIYKCFACDLRGDLVKWLRDRESMSCRDAHQAAGQDCATSCPQYAACHGAGINPRRRRALTPRRSEAAASVRTTDNTPPAERWQQWATALQVKAAAALQQRLSDLAWLAARGIDADAARRAGLGWLAHDQRPERAAIGLPPRQGKDRLWVPAGLVIPTWQDGALHRLRIRRPQADRERLLPDLKFYQVEGSGRAPLAIHPAGDVRGAVVVEAELDAIACAAHHPDILAVSVQTAAGGLTEQLRDLVAAAPVILVALDADPTDNPAGQKAVRAWLDTFRQARYWPVPAGKDPGEYAANGDLGDWLEAGLPPRIAPRVADLAPITAPAPAETLAQAPIPAPSAGPATTLLAVEAGGEGAGGNDGGVGLDKLCAHLRDHRGWIERTPDELFVRYAAWAESPVVAAERNRMVLAVYGELGDVLEGLPVGRFGWQGLRQAVSDLAV